MFTAPLNRLRQSTWLAAIPDTRPGRAISIDPAAVDEVAVALVALSEQVGERR